MIVSYRDKRTREFAAGKRVKAFSGIERSAQLKLDRVEAAVSLRDLAVLPGNRFEVLVGDRKGQYSIRINGSMTNGGSVSSGRKVPSVRSTLRSSTIIRRQTVARPAIHPGEQLA